MKNQPLVKAFIEKVDALHQTLAPLDQAKAEELDVRCKQLHQFYQEISKTPLTLDAIHGACAHMKRKLEKEEKTHDHFAAIPPALRK